MAQGLVPSRGGTLRLGADGAVHAVEGRGGNRGDIAGGAQAALRGDAGWQGQNLAAAQRVRRRKRVERGQLRAVQTDPRRDRGHGIAVTGNGDLIGRIGDDAPAVGHRAVLAGGIRGAAGVDPVRTQIPIHPRIVTGADQQNRHQPKGFEKHLRLNLHPRPTFPGFAPMNFYSPPSPSTNGTNRTGRNSS